MRPRLLIGGLLATAVCVLLIELVIDRWWRRADGRRDTRDAASASAEARQVAGAVAPKAVPAYDPTAFARERGSRVGNPEAVVPPLCYTKTGGASNPCWVCHTQGLAPNHLDDSGLQEEYAFSTPALTNRWSNLFEDWRAAAATIDDAEIVAWIGQDNYAPLRTAMAEVAGYPGWVPDLDLAQGFDEAGFAKDGSGWRALRYKPFPGMFWPSNGSTDDVYLRLPPVFRRTRSEYAENLELVIAAMTTQPGQESKLPARYLGGAAEVALVARELPVGTELLHSVRYLDPDAPGKLPPRMKELRYMVKLRALDGWAAARAHERELDDKAEGKLPAFAGDALTGLVGDHGWKLQGWIEDATGRLRLQTREEHLTCMGCHGNLGVTVDRTFSLARKLPGAEGWRVQDLAGMVDAPQVGHAKPEALTYFERVGAGDELRANDELRARFFDAKGRVREADVRRAARGGDRDLLWLLSPSRERALALNRAYLALVRAQRFELGRDALLAPAVNVHRNITNGSTELGRTKRLFRDGGLMLDWTR